MDLYQTDTFVKQILITIQSIGISQTLLYAQHRFKLMLTVESGEKSIRKYLTRTKPKTMLKIETNTYNEHQEQLPQTEYSQGNSGETHKTREKPEAIHSPTPATKQHNYQYSEQEKFISRN